MEDFQFAKKFMEWGDESLDQHIQEFNKDDDAQENGRGGGGMSACISTASSSASPPEIRDQQNSAEDSKPDDNVEEIQFLEKNVLNDAGEGNSHVDISTVSCVSCGEEVSREAANV